MGNNPYINSVVISNLTLHSHLTSTIFRTIYVNFVRSPESTNFIQYLYLQHDHPIRFKHLKSDDRNAARENKKELGNAIESSFISSVAENFERIVKESQVTITNR